MTRTVHINRDPLWASLMELKQIGAYDDEATGLRGVRRLALTDTDTDAEAPPPPAEPLTGPSGCSAVLR